MPKKLKIETWLKKLPEPYAKLALKAFKEHPFPHMSDYSWGLGEAVDNFIWRDTQEGVEFWSTVSEWALWKPAPPRPKLPKLPKKKK